MRHDFVSLNAENEDAIAYSSLISNSSNRGHIEDMKKAVSLALMLELTSRQRECITMYYLQNRSIPQIASELSLSRSTVSRHITAGKKKLMKLAKYY